MRYSQLIAGLKAAKIELDRKSLSEIAVADPAGGKGEPVTLATLHGFVISEGTAWQFMREEMRRYYEHALASRQEVRPPPRPPQARLLELAAMEPPPVARELFASTLAGARLLGKRTAELHLAFASGTQEGLGTEPYSALDQRSTYQS